MPDVEFIIKLQVSALEEGICDDKYSIENAPLVIQAEKATASFINERNLIFDIMRKTKGGFALVNIQIKKFLRKWCISELTKIADNASKVDGRIYYHIGSVMNVFYENDIARECYKKALDIYFATVYCHSIKINIEGFFITFANHSDTAITFSPPSRKPTRPRKIRLQPRVL